MRATLELLGSGMYSRNVMSCIAFFFQCTVYVVTINILKKIVRLGCITGSYPQKLLAVNLISPNTSAADSCPLQ